MCCLHALNSSLLRKPRLLPVNRLSNLDEVLVGEVKGIDCEHVSDGWRACHQEGLAAQRRVDSEETVVRGGFGKFPRRNPCVIGKQDWVVPCQNSSTLLYVSFVFVPVYHDAM